MGAGHEQDTITISLDRDKLYCLDFGGFKFYGYPYVLENIIKSATKDCYSLESKPR